MGYRDKESYNKTARVIGTAALRAGFIRKLLWQSPWLFRPVKWNRGLVKMVLLISRESAIRFLSGWLNPWDALLCLIGIINKSLLSRPLVRIILRIEFHNHIRRLLPKDTNYQSQSFTSKESYAYHWRCLRDSDCLACSKGSAYWEPYTPFKAFPTLLFSCHTISL